MRSFAAVLAGLVLVLGSVNNGIHAQSGDHAQPAVDIGSGGNNNAQQVVTVLTTESGPVATNNPGTPAVVVVTSTATSTATPTPTSPSAENINVVTVTSTLGMDTPTPAMVTVTSTAMPSTTATPPVVVVTQSTTSTQTSMTTVVTTEPTPTQTSVTTVVTTEPTPTPTRTTVVTTEPTPTPTPVTVITTATEATPTPTTTGPTPTPTGTPWPLPFPQEPTERRCDVKALVQGRALGADGRALIDQCMLKTSQSDDQNPRGAFVPGTAVFNTTTGCSACDVLFLPNSSAVLRTYLSMMNGDQLSVANGTAPFNPLNEPPAPFWVAKIETWLNATDVQSTGGTAWFNVTLDATKNSTQTLSVLGTSVDGQYVQPTCLRYTEPFTNVDYASCSVSLPGPPPQVHHVVTYVASKVVDGTNDYSPQNRLGISTNARTEDVDLPVKLPVVIERQLTGYGNSTTVNTKLDAFANLPTSRPVVFRVNQLPSSGSVSINGFPATTDTEIKSANDVIQFVPPPGGGVNETMTFVLVDPSNNVAYPDFTASIQFYGPTVSPSPVVPSEPQPDVPQPSPVVPPQPVPVPLPSPDVPPQPVPVPQPSPDVPREPDVPEPSPTPTQPAEPPKMAEAQVNSSVIVPIALQGEREQGYFVDGWYTNVTSILDKPLVVSGQLQTNSNGTNPSDLSFIALRQKDGYFYVSNVTGENLEDSVKIANSFLEGEKRNRTVTNECKPKEFMRGNYTSDDIRRAWENIGDLKDPSVTGCKLVNFTVDSTGQYELTIPGTFMLPQNNDARPKNDTGEFIIETMNEFAPVELAFAVQVQQNGSTTVSTSTDSVTIVKFVLQPSTETGQLENNSNALSTDTIILIVASSLIAVLLASTFAVLLVRQRRNAEDEESIDTEGDQPPPLDTINNRDSVVYDNPLYEYPPPFFRNSQLLTEPDVPALSSPTSIRPLSTFVDENVPTLGDGGTATMMDPDLTESYFSEDDRRH